MRALYLLSVVLVLAIAGWLVARHANDLYCRAVLNKAIHEYSTDREKDAIDRAVALLKHTPSYRPALEQAVQWLAEQKQFTRARSLAHDYATTVGLSEPARFSLAVSAYETGDEDAATRLMKTFDLETGAARRLPGELVRSYLAMANGDFESALAPLEAADSHLEGDLFYHSLMGRIQYSRDNIAKAAEEIQKAVALGEENPRARLILAVCRALLGDTPGMERLLDELEAAGRGGYALASAEIEGRLQRLETVRRYASPSQQAAHETQTVNLRLALAAVAVRQGRIEEAHTRYVALTEEYPHRLGLFTQLGLFREPRLDLEPTLEAYRAEADRLLLAGYKLRLLDSTSIDTADAAFWDRFLPSGSLVLDARGMDPSAGIATHPGWNMFASGGFSTTFTLASTGEYAIGAIARGEPAGDIWPIVVVSIDGDNVASLYVNSPVLDYYEFEHEMPAGLHSIQLYYLNNAVPEGVKGDRNFILDKVIVRPKPN